MEKERPKIGIGVLVKRGDKILIGRRLGNHGSGTWMIPGGHLEFGESFEECAIREVAEETGLTDLKVVGVVSVGNDIAYDKHYVSIGVLLESVSGEPTCPEPDKSGDWDWYDPCELPEPFFSPSYKVITNWLNQTFYSDGKEK